ncbi:MAG: indole-3-glycerol phosphate synthase [Nitrospinae bacterium CG11_big_fil_rev_8_21_14_0_20_56_8]|nr:MAG: indole-3-glycerol phosphate synthase [Nitrospinae bacterium CG11_big_fil_rev_8_21_14_0_20_56_8]
MSTILDRIFSDKKDEVDSAKRNTPLTELKGRIRQEPAPRNVKTCLRAYPPSRIIAEIKLRTPFKGVLRDDLDPVDIAKIYAAHGAATLSILTENKYFGGSLDIFCRVRQNAHLPLLRKDFIFSEYQVYESRAFGADWFLLIATWLDKNQLGDLLALGREMGLPALVETHDERDLEKALTAQAEIVGINNRDLTCGKTDLGIARRLIPMARQADPNLILVCESGIHGRPEIRELESLGAHAFLIGESLMTAKDIPAKLTDLLGRDPDDRFGVA